MPTYQYACTACGHQLDAVQSFADDPLWAVLSEIGMPVSQHVASNSYLATLRAADPTPMRGVMHALPNILMAESIGWWIVAAALASRRNRLRAGEVVAIGGDKLSRGLTLEGLTALRIIHGRGIGVQRETVRTVLARTEFVDAFGDAPAEAGGWGATIVTLKP